MSTNRKKPFGPWWALPLLIAGCSGDDSQVTPGSSSGGSRPRSGCAVASAKVLAAGFIGPYAMAVDSANLFYTDYRNGRVERIPKNDFAHTCIANHFDPCGACAGALRCDGTCTNSCNEAGTD